LALLISLESTMPWKKVSTMDLRKEFVQLASGSSLSMRALCRRFGISPKTGYKWVKRYALEGGSGLRDRSRRPHHQPARTHQSVEAIVLGLRQRFPDWGGRKLARLMSNAGYSEVPSPSTITEILRRNGALHSADQPAPKNTIRFEHPFPNDLWQMDFKGHFALSQGRCFPLTILDDHSRFSVCLAACAYERFEPVKANLIKAFRLYGLPLGMTMDNGPPWGCGEPHRLTQLGVWLIEQGICVSHSRPYHPQTQGKDERFHRTLKAELLGRRSFADLEQCQQAFDPWRQIYNTVRPHESLQMDTPIEHYQPSPRPYHEHLPQFEYGPGDHVRKVCSNLTCSFKNYAILVGQGLKGKHVAFRPTQNDAVYDLYFCHQRIGKVDLKGMNNRTVKGYNRMEW